MTPMVCWTFGNSDPPQFCFKDDGESVTIGYQTSWKTWDDFRVAYDRQLENFMREVPPLQEFSRAYERRKPAPAEHARTS